MALLWYTLNRVVLVFAAGGLLVLSGFNYRSPVTWMFAVAVGALVSYLLLDRPRRAAVTTLAQFRFSRIRSSSRITPDDAAAREEDALLDTELRARPSPGSEPRP